MGNAVANKWRATLYYRYKSQCEDAIKELTAEEKRLTGKITSMKKTNQEYEINVISHLSDALSQMDGTVKTTIKKARELLAENYKGITKGVKETKENLNESNNKITESREQIERLKTLVKAKQAAINQLINNCNNEISEVRAEKSRAMNAKSKFDKPKNILY